MTPEALSFRNAVVQTIRERFSNPLYSILLYEYGGREMHAHQMMVLGSVLLPEPTHDGMGDPPAFYLDDAGVRALIASQLATHPREFFHHANIASWGRIGRSDSSLTLARRFYLINRASESSWGYVLVPNEEEKNAEGSFYAADAVTLPDFLNVTDSMRYTAIGA